MDEKTEIYIRLLTPILSILLCIVSLSATTWAWYTDSVSTSTNSINAMANEANVVITSPVNAESGVNALSSSELLIADENGYYRLAKDNTYLITITNDGKASNGYYCEIVTIDDNGETNTFSTAKLENGSISFEITSTFDSKIKFYSKWGEPQSVDIYSDDSKVLVIDEKGAMRFADNSNYAFRDEANTEIITYKYSISFIEEETNNQIKEKVIDVTDQQVIALNKEDYLIEGYILTSLEDYEIVDDILYLNIDETSDVTEFILKYEKISGQNEPSKADENVEEPMQDIDSPEETGQVGSIDTSIDETSNTLEESQKNLTDQDNETGESEANEAGVPDIPEEETSSN